MCSSNKAAEFILTCLKTQITRIFESLEILDKMILMNLNMVSLDLKYCLNHISHNKVKYWFGKNEKKNLANCNKISHYHQIQGSGKILLKIT